jgi:two-component system, LytTR family, sensor kinase
MLVVALTYVPDRSKALFVITTEWGIWSLGSCALRSVCRSLFRRSFHWAQLQLAAFGWSFCAGITAAVIIRCILREPWDWNGVARDTVNGAILLLFWCNLYFSLKQWQRSADERERLARAEAVAREARLSALRNQLNPHFLFNSLNSVSTLVVEGNAPAATRMLTQIAELLRTTLEGPLLDEVSLSEEVDFIKRYLAIEQTRLGERLQVEMAIGPDTLDAAVPTLFLQPLVENAIRHGIAPAVAGGSIAIRSERQSSQLRILVKNTGNNRGQPGEIAKGIGLVNTFERLRTLYGSDQKINLQWPESGGCEVLIEIPFRKSAIRAGEVACAY